MRMLLVTTGPTLAAVYLFVAARLLGWADSLMEISATIRRAVEAD